MIGAAPWWWFSLKEATVSVADEHVPERDRETERERERERDEQAFRWRTTDGPFRWLVGITDVCISSRRRL